MKYEFEKVGRYMMIHITGNIDTAESTKQLDTEISGRIKQGQHHFVFNLKRTTYLDSAGISIFIHCLCDVQENNGSISLDPVKAKDLPKYKSKFVAFKIFDTLKYFKNNSTRW